MFELTINEKVYGFKFGLAFMREINKKVQQPIEGVKDQKQDVGLRFAVASLMDGDPIELVNVLDLANKTESPRVTRKELDAYIEDENTDIDGLFTEVLDFLRKNNVTKKVVAFVEETIEAEKEKAKTE